MEMLKDYLGKLSEKLKEPRWLREFREKSLVYYLTLPEEQSQLYVKHSEKIEVKDEEIARDFKEYTYIHDEASSLLQIDKPIIVNAGPTTVGINIPQKLRSEGVIVETIQDALKNRESLIKRYILDRLVKPSEDKYAAMNNAFFNSGLFVYIPKGISVEDPIRYVCLLDGENSPIISQVIIIADDNSQLTFIEEVRPSSETDLPSLYSSLVEVYGGESATVRYASIQATGYATKVLINRKFRSDAYADIAWMGALVGGAITRFRLENLLEGNGSRADELEAILGSRGQKFDVLALLTHKGTDTTGRVMAKGVLRDQARSLLKGMIRIDKNAKNANSYLADHAMLLSRKAKADAIPGLEIESNEVKATHSASVSQVDPDQVFYIVSRGIPEDEAIKVIALSFFEPVIKEIPVAEVRWGIRYLLERKWAESVGKAVITPDDMMELYVEAEEVGRPSKDIFAQHYKYVRTRE